MGFTWTSSLMTGIDQVDQEHKQLIEQVENLYEAMSKGQGDARIREILNFLEKYTVEHFRNEERLYQKHGYPDLNRHKEIHAQFIEDFGQLKQEFLSNQSDHSLAIKVNKLAMSWLTNHIGKEDKQACQYIKNNR